MTVLGAVRGRACLIVDDMASTGRTLAGAAVALREAGARSIDAIFTHPVMAGGAWEQLCAAPLERLITSDSISLPAHPRLQVIRTAPLLAGAIRNISGNA
jgi:ribose-phosphate pyrophosphokinase